MLHPAPRATLPLLVGQEPGVMVPTFLIFDKCNPPVGKNKPPN